MAAAGIADAQPEVARIVSTSPSTTEVLFALGLGNRVVGVSVYCRYPAAAEALPKVGNFLRPNTEVIARLRPDLVIVGRGSNDVPRQLAELGIPTITFDDARTLESVYSISARSGVRPGSLRAQRHLLPNCRDGSTACARPRSSAHRGRCSSSSGGAPRA